MIKRKDDIKASFATNSVPTQADFADLIDSGINQADDGLKKSPGDPLTIIAGGDTQEVFSFYKSFGAKKPAWNTNLNPAGDSPGLNFYTQNGSSRLFISEDTGNVGIGNTSLKKVPGLTGPFLQIGSDAEGPNSDGQLILSKRSGGSTRSFKMGLDKDCNFTLGDFGNCEDLTYTPALTIGWENKNVTIPQSLNVGNTVSSPRINIGIANTANAIAMAGPVLQIGNDAVGENSGQLILSKRTDSNGWTRSFKMGVDDNYNFSLGDFGKAVDTPRVYNPGLVISCDTQDVTIPKKLNISGGLMLNGDGKIVFRESANNSISLVSYIDLGLYSTIAKHNMRLAVNQAAIAFFNNKSGETIGEGNLSLLIDANGNVGIGNGTSFEVLKSGTDPVLQIGNDAAGDNAGQLILSKHKSGGDSRSFKMGLDDNFAFSIGDYGCSPTAQRNYTPALTIDWKKRNVTVLQSLFVKGKVAGGNGINLKNNGGIRLVANTEDDTVSGHSDLGLYSTIKNWCIRIAANQAPIAFFNNKEGEAEYGVDMSMLIDANRNVGIGTNEVYGTSATVGSGPILQIGNDNKTKNTGQLLLSKYDTKTSGSRTFKMFVNDAYSFSIGDYGYNGQTDRKYDAAIVIRANDQIVEIPKGLTVKGSTVTGSDIRIKKDVASCDTTASLDILKKLNIADYRHIDPINFGDKLVKGLIAQQVEKEFPEAVITSKGFIPSILSAPGLVMEADGVVTFRMAKPHMLIDGDIVKIHTNNGDKEKTITVVDENNFSVEDTADEYQDNVVIYGKQVNDFKSIEYNRLFILNLSATQQLAKDNKELRSDLLNLSTAQKQLEDMELKKIKFALEFIQEKLLTIEDKHRLEAMLVNLT